jgi:hypothetical protein
MRLFAALLVMSIGCGAALSAEPDAKNQRVANAMARWEFTLTPYVLVPTIAGNATTGRLPNTSFQVTPGTILENLRFGAMGRGEILYEGRWSATLDAAYMDLGAGRTLPAVGGTIDAGVRQLVVEGFAGYRFWTKDRNWAEAYAGGRWWHNELSVAVNVPGTTFSRTLVEDWVDPVIGLRGRAFVADAWSVYGSGNIGGFGLVSDFTWSVEAGVDYHVSDTMALLLHYKALGVDYHNGKTGVGAFAYDTITHGPLIGLSIRF